MIVRSFVRTFARTFACVFVLMCVSVYVHVGGYEYTRIHATLSHT